jgi:hypothetical protein
MQYCAPQLKKPRRNIRKFYIDFFDAFTKSIFMMRPNRDMVHVPAGQKDVHGIHRSES